MVAMLLVNLFIYHKSSKSSTRGQFVLSKTCLVKVKGVFPRSTAQQSMYAKQILRIAVAQTAIALSQAMDSSEPNTQPLDDFQERVYGPLDAVRGTPHRAATIPAYVVMNGRVVYTIDVDELPEEAIQYESDGDWVYYIFGSPVSCEKFPYR